MNEGSGRGGALAMAGESSGNPQRALRPPPLLFQFPSLPTPWPVQNHHHPQQQQVQQQHFPAPILLTEQQLRLLQQPAAERNAFHQLANFQRQSPTPDLNRPPLQVTYLPPPFHLGHPQQQPQQQQQFLLTQQQLQLQLQQQQKTVGVQKNPVFKSPSVAPAVNHRQEAPMQRPNPGGYPVAAAAHKEVVSVPQLFMKTLATLSSDLGLELIVPRIRGKELKLHRLYCAVTELGGLEKVTREKMWKDIATEFDLPRTVTNPVYFLRKHYTNLLHHYEQVYYHRKQGPLVPPPDDLPKPLPVEVKPRKTELSNAPKSRKRKTELSNAPKSRKRGRRTEADWIGKTVTGAIEGKFEHGYFVTVVLGSEKLRGVIYDDGKEPAAAEAASPVKPRQKKLPSQGRQKKRRKRAAKSPDGVKPVRKPYNFFVAEQRQKLKGAWREMSRIIGKLWNELSQEDRLPYVEMARKDKERYEKEKLGSTDTAEDEHPVAGDDPAQQQ